LKLFYDELHSFSTFFALNFDKKLAVEAQYVTEKWHIPTLKNWKFTKGKPKTVVVIY
jgi:hypothetical protein